MPLSIATNRIDYAAKHGAKAVQITGGEPFLHSNLHEIIEHIHSRGMYSLLATSGYDHSVERYSRLRCNGLDALCISINALDEDINKRTRDTYAISLSAIRNAREAGLVCCANVVVSDENIEDLELFASYLKRIGVTRIDILNPVTSFDGGYVPIVSSSTIKILDSIIRKSPDFFRVENCYKKYWEYKTGRAVSCNEIGNHAVFVNVDGSFSPCSKLQRYRYDSMDELIMNKLIWKGGC